jgi:hypothetical protein
MKSRMKFAALAVTIMAVLGLSDQSFAKKRNCTDNIDLNVQGQILTVKVGSLGLLPMATIAGRQVRSWVDSNSQNKIVVEIPKDLLPTLTESQITQYDRTGIDHHTITEYEITVSDSQVKGVVYRRYQEIDFGRGAESTKMKFTHAVRTDCAQ